MASTSNTCGNCHRSSNQTDGWWTVHEYKDTPKTYQLCPRCYNNRALIAQREAMIEAIQRIRLGHSDPAISTGMQMMKDWCIQAIKDSPYEGS